MLSTRHALAKKRLASSLTTYAVLFFLVFLTVAITLFLYVTNQQNKQNRLQRQEPIVIKVNIGANPMPVPQAVMVPVVNQAEVEVTTIEQ